MKPDDREGGEPPAETEPPTAFAAGTGAVPDPDKPGAVPRPIVLSPRAWRRLGPHLGAGGWTPESLIEELIAEGLHRAYPEITYRGACVAQAGCYRAFDRVSLRPAMRMKSSRGEFVIRVRPYNEDYVKWLASYQRRDDPEPERKASEMCVFELEQELQKVDAGKRIIYPDDFLVEVTAPG